MLCERLMSRLMLAKRLERRFFSTFSLGFMLAMVPALQQTNHQIWFQSVKNSENKNIPEEFHYITISQVQKYYPLFRKN